MSDQTQGQAEPARDPFEWLGADRRALRGDLRTIRKSVRAGWLDEEPGRREKLMAALNRLELDGLTPREFLQLARLYTDMNGQNIADEKAAIELAKKLDLEEYPRVVIVQDKSVFDREL